MDVRLPVPPFDRDAAIERVRRAEDGWNSRYPHRAALAYSPGSRWRNRAESFEGRAAIIDFLTRKWLKELDCRLIKGMSAFAHPGDGRASVVS